VTKAAVQAEYRVNGSNQRDTGHSAEATPPAAMADYVDASIMLSFQVSCLEKLVSIDFAGS
jgi:hypothetical protein